MGQPKITEIEAQLGEWEFLKELPQEIDGFKLTMGQGIDGQILTIASYSNEAMHSKLDLIYTSETFDYVPVKTIGSIRLEIFAIFAATGINLLK